MGFSGGFPPASEGTRGLSAASSQVGPDSSPPGRGERGVTLLDRLSKYLLLAQAVSSLPPSLRHAYTHCIITLSLSP